MSTWMDLGEKEAEKVYSGIPDRQVVKEQPLASERRAFWREAYMKHLDRGVSYISARNSAEIADAALKEFDERFGK